MDRRALVCLLFVASAALAACESRNEAAPPKAPAPAASATPANEAEPSSSAASEADAGSVRPRKPFEIYNACTEVVTVAFGEDPKAAGAGTRTLAPSSSIEGPRGPDGSQIVWLLDKAGNGMIKARVSRGNKRVEIGRSCSTISSF